jgi:hypothetical protein
VLASVLRTIQRRQLDAGEVIPTFFAHLNRSPRSRRHRSVSQHDLLE